MKKSMSCVGIVLVSAMAGSSQAATVDLINNGFGSIGNARFIRADNRSSGTGVIQSFVRIQNNGTEQGYNTSGRPLQFDENSSPSFTRLLTFGQVPTVIGTGAFGLTAGTAYKEFLLDINQQDSNPFLSLNRLRLYTNTSGFLNNLNDFTGLGPLVYDMGTTNEVDMNYTLNTGSGQGDMALYIPVADFGAISANTAVYLYSQFGLTAGMTSNDGFEEWSVQTSVQLIPLPPAVWIGGSSLAGLFGLGAIRRRVTR